MHFSTPSTSTRTARISATFREILCLCFRCVCRLARSRIQHLTLRRLDASSEHFRRSMSVTSCKSTTALDRRLFYYNDTEYTDTVSGRKWALIFADIIFLIGSLVQTLCALGTTNLAQLYVGRVIGGFGVGLISAVVPTYIGENANKEIRGRCIGW
jgi:hypothetical protein